ncbi:MAG: hypothetical protein ACE5G1_04180 [bacterium]
MRSFRIGLHAFLLALANIVAIIAAYGLYYFFRPGNQIAFQVPIAALLSIAAFVVWCKSMHGSKNLSCQNHDEFILTYLVAFLWSPVIFILMHYTTQGYVTAFGNMIGIWLFQLPTNLIAIIVTKKILKSSGETQNLIVGK